jgi:hypothetical protein
MKELEPSPEMKLERLFRRDRVQRKAIMSIETSAMAPLAAMIAICVVDQREPSADAKHLS